MRIATLSDRERVIEILSIALKDDPGVLATIKNDNRKNDRIKGLMAFAFDTFQPIGGVHLSEDGQSAAVSYVPADQKTPIRDLLLHLKLLFKVVGVFRVGEAMKKKAMIERAHPKDGKFQNVWLMGTLLDEPEDAIQSVKRYLLDRAASQQIPLYVETGDEKERDEYQRMGLEVHKTVELAPSIYLWFMRTPL